MNANSPATPPAADSLSGWQRYRWLPYLLPLAVYMVLGQFESTAAGYPLSYTVRIAATSLAVIVTWPALREFRFSVHPLSIAAGVLGAVLWIGICRLQVEHRLLEPLGLSGFLQLGTRAGFDPLEALGGRQLALIGFLAVRFFGLVLVVPFIEEFFLRGFLMRFFAQENWWELPLSQIGRVAIPVGLVYGALSHPAELLAAMVWFSLVTWLMFRTGSLWDCIVAHMTTNLLLGVYVLVWREWWLW